MVQRGEKKLVPTLRQLFKLVNAHEVHADLQRPLYRHSFLHPGHDLRFSDETDSKYHSKQVSHGVETMDRAIRRILQSGTSFNASSFFTSFRLRPFDLNAS